MSDPDLRELERVFLASPSAEAALRLATAARRQESPDALRTALRHLLALATWDELDDASRRACCELLAPLLAPRFTPLGLQRCEQADSDESAFARDPGRVEREVAFYRDAAGRELALVPGGTVQLGYDPKTFKGRGLARKLERAGIDSLKPVRTVELEPLLVQREPESQARLEHASLVQRLAAEGYRLLRSDEWEHCCSAGRRTLFRWGDSFSTDEEDPVAKAPNAFGLRFHGSPAGVELCLEPDLVRNGDGGVALHGGAGAAAFLPLSAWYERKSARDGSIFRRAVSLLDVVAARETPAT